MNERKPSMHSRQQGHQKAARHQAVLQCNESTIAVQQPVHDEKNSLLFTQILSGLVWNG